MSILDILRPVPHAPRIQDQTTLSKTYRHWRIRIFYSIYVGYVFYYFSRKSVTFAMPAIMAEMGFSKAEMGLLASLLSIMCGVSKFVSGMIADRSNPRYFMSIGLMMTGVTTLFFGFSSSLLFFSIFSIANGWFQGWGWPPCARQLSHWYSQKERGRWWGVWNTSSSLGVGLIAILAASLSEYWGWRTAVCGPAILCILAAFFVMNRLRDTPQSLGLPPIEQFKNDYPSASPLSENELTTKEILFKYVLNNHYIWVLAVAYFFVYLIRQAVTDWGVLFLLETQHYSKLFASSCIVIYEIGGFCGSLASGWLSDYLFKGQRGPVSVIFSLGVIFPLGALLWSPVHFPWLDNLLFGLTGFLIYGPQMLIGMHAAELAHKKAAATATGFIGWSAYLGAAVAGYPLSLIAQNYGWNHFLFFLVGCGVIALILLAPLWSAKARYPKHVQT